MSIACPLRLAPIPVPKVWGGDRLRGLVGDGVSDGDWPDQPIGEVWLVSDREGRASRVLGGPFDGRSLRGLMLSEREALLGDAQPSPDGSFPLLLKLLEARQNLSVQVHPDESAAKSLGSSAKNECWYVLDAEPEAEVLLGIAEGVDRSEFARDASTARVIDLLRRFPVRAGEAVDVPAGTVHGICAGIAVAEVQNNSDTTYRLFDWDRKGLDGAPREMHLSEALRSIDYDARCPAPGPLEFEEHASNRRATLHGGAHFHADVLEVHESTEIGRPRVPVALYVVEGSGHLVAGDAEPVELRRGTTWLIPADAPGARILDASGDLRLLRAVPR